MRDRRLLTLAVLVVALGFSAVAMADTAVVTLIEGSGTFDVNLRLWADSGIGDAATSGGALDFAIKSIAGTGDYEVLTANHAAPTGQVTDGTDTYDAGFSAIIGDGQATEFGPVGLQPVAYDANANNNPLRDAAVLTGVGITAYDGVSGPASGTWADGGTPAAYDADAKIITGDFVDNGGGGTLELTTFGTDSISVIPTAPFTGPLTGGDEFGTPVNAVVVQTALTAGNDGGGAVAANPTIMRIAVGDITLGANALLGTQQGVGGAASTQANVTVNVTDANTSVTFGANQVLAGLNVGTDADGTQLADLNGNAVAIYAGDAGALNAAEDGIVTDLAAGVSSAGAEGLVDPGVRDGMSIGFARKTDAGGTDYTEVKLTFLGDVNVDGVVDPADSGLVNVNWDPSGTSPTVLPYKWYLGDLNLDGVIDPADAGLVNVWWNPSGDPIPAAGGMVPEPCTLGLLTFGALGLIRRRRA